MNNTKSDIASFFTSFFTDIKSQRLLTHFRPMFQLCRNQVVGFVLAKRLKNTCGRVTF